MVEEEEAARRKVAHELGQRLDDLSLRDFDDRIALLRAEIDRLQAARDVKEAALADARSVFKTVSKT